MLLQLREEYLDREWFFLVKYKKWHNWFNKFTEDDFATQAIWVIIYWTASCITAPNAWL